MIPLCATIGSLLSLQSAFEILLSSNFNTENYLILLHGMDLTNFTSFLMGEKEKKDGMEKGVGKEKETETDIDLDLDKGIPSQKVNQNLNLQFWSQTSLLWIYNHLCFPDHFLHFVVNSKTH